MKGFEAHLDKMSEAARLLGYALANETSSALALYTVMAQRLEKLERRIEALEAQAPE